MPSNKGIQIGRALLAGGAVMALVFLVFGVEIARILVSGVGDLLGVLQQRAPVFIGVGAGLFFTWLMASQIRSRRTQAVMLKHRRCPHCGYDIRGLPTDPDDGATICPECGCACQLARDTSPRGAAARKDAS